MDKSFRDAETAVVGDILIDPRCLPEIRRVLADSSAFSVQACADIFTAACRRADSGQALDFLGILDDCPNVSRDFVVQAMQITPTAANAGTHAQLVQDGFTRRKLAEIGLAMQEPEGSAEEAITQARAALDKLAAQQTVAAAKPGDDLRALLDYRAEMECGTRRVLRTGFPSLDGILGSWQPGGLYIIGARPSVGKSAFGICLADMFARQGKQALFLSLEMTLDEIAARRIAAFSQSLKSYQNILSVPNFSDAETEDLDATTVKLADRPLAIQETPQLTAAKAGVLARNVRAEVLFIDYIGLMDGAGKSEYERITGISTSLKRLARTLGIVVVALCQLNRATEERKDNRPKLSDLRSSGALEQDADAVMLLHRPEKDNDQSWEPFEVDVAKNRHGRAGRITLSFAPATNRFIDSGRIGNKSFEVKSWD